MLMERRRLLIFIHDALMVSLAWVLAVITRSDFNIVESDIAVSGSFLLPLLISHLFFSWQLGLYKNLWRYVSLTDLWGVCRVVSYSTIAAIILAFSVNHLGDISRTSLFLFPFFAIALLGIPRLLNRFWKNKKSRDGDALTATKNAIIIGGGDAGYSLISDMLREGSYKPVAVLDDRQQLQGTTFHGVPVKGYIKDIERVANQYEADLVIIAVPSATNTQMRTIVEHCERVNIPFRTLPPLKDLVAGRVSVNALREVLIDDLLGRDEVSLDWALIESVLKGKTVLITGGGGSIGSELSRQIARLEPGKLIIIEQSEYNLYEIEREIKASWPDIESHCHLGDIRDEVAIDKLFETYRPSVVFHAAAYKHVPMLQNQLREAVTNNVLGTKCIADAATRYKTETFVLISTDKAVNPTNYMGATKRVAEIYCQALSRSSSTRFVTVRFGNVLGSAGSVVPLLQEQIAQGGPVTVTHPEITRYFMTISEASLLILQAGSMGNGGEVFVLDMGEPIRVAYLAEQVILLSGMIPGEDIAIEYIGLRPGEKLHEELLYLDENLLGTTHSKVLLANSRDYETTKLGLQMNEMSVLAAQYDTEGLEALMTRLVPELHAVDTAQEDNVISFEEHVS